MNLLKTSQNADRKTITTLKEHIVEIISDSGEGAQRCGQSLGSIAARMGNGIWTTEIIPAEIRPPARSVAGASGIRMLYEMVLQLQGRAGPRQLKNPSIGLTHNLGGQPSQNVCSISIVGLEGA